MSKKKAPRPKRVVDYNHSCRGKVRFKSHKLAEASISRHGEPMRIYRCTYCHNWHLTSKVE